MDLTSLRLVNSQNYFLEMRPELAKSGGEGWVIPLKNAPGFHGMNAAVKIYKKEIPKEKIAKLKYMVSASNKTLLSVCAWPVDLVYDKKRTKILGAIIPFARAHQNLFHVYAAGLRSVSFPEADWSFLICVGMNICRAVSLLHAQKIVIGDLNHSNILVASDGKIVLIDTDSFQLRGNGATWLCGVGTPEYLPPELHGADLRTTVRTLNHDCFSLAVILFQLLFLGRHPFSGRIGDLDQQTMIRKNAYMFGAGCAVDAPDGELSLQPEDAGLTIKNLFLSAFDGAHNSSGRPSASEWYGALEALLKETEACEARVGHVRLRGRPCPWCRIEKAYGGKLTLFPQPHSPPRKVSRRARPEEKTPHWFVRAAKKIFGQ